MHKYLFLFLSLFVASQASVAQEVLILSPRECVTYSLVQYDLKLAVDAGAQQAELAKFPFPKGVDSEIKDQMLQVTTNPGNKEISPLDFAHNFLDFCIRNAGHFLPQEKSGV